MRAMPLTSRERARLVEALLFVGSELTRGMGKQDGSEDEGVWKN